MSRRGYPIHVWPCAFVPESSRYKASVNRLYIIELIYAIDSSVSKDPTVKYTAESVYIEGARRKRISQNVGASSSANKWNECPRREQDISSLPQGPAEVKHLLLDIFQTAGFGLNRPSGFDIAIHESAPYIVLVFTRDDSYSQSYTTFSVACRALPYLNSNHENILGPQHIWVRYTATTDFFLRNSRGIPNTMLWSILAAPPPVATVPKGNIIPPLCHKLGLTLLIIKQVITPAPMLATTHLLTEASSRPGHSLGSWILSRLSGTGSKGEDMKNSCL